MDVYKLILGEFTMLDNTSKLFCRMKYLCQEDRSLFVCVIIYSLTLFIDYLTPLGYADWLFYLIPLMPAFTFKRSQIIYVPTMATVLIFIGIFLSPQGINLIVAVF